MRKSIVFLFILVLVSCSHQALAASYPAVAYQSPTEEVQEHVVQPQDYNLLGTQYLFDDPAGAFQSGWVDLDGIYASPFYINSGTGFSESDDEIDFGGGTVYDLIYSSVWGYLVADINGNGALDNNEDPWLIGDFAQGALIELYQLPLSDNLWFLVILALCYSLFLFFRIKIKSTNQDLHE